MIKIISGFKACENGIDVNEYKAGEQYETLPPIALSFGRANGFIAEETKEETAKPVRRPARAKRLETK